MNYVSQMYYSSLVKVVDYMETAKNVAQSMFPTSITEAREMIFAKNSQKIYSSQLKTDEVTEFSELIQRKIIKLKQHNKNFFCKQPVCTLLCNDLISSNPTVIIYKSSDDNSDLNCKVNALTQEPSYRANDKTIVCRHIAYGYATESFKFNEIDSKEKLQQHHFFQKDYEKYYCYYFPAEGYYFQSKYLGKVLQDIAKNLLASGTVGYKSYLLYTHTHAMAIRIKFNNNHWKIKFYDPNFTLAETIAIVTSIDDILLLQVNDFINKSELDIYLRFGSELCINSTNTEATQPKCKTHIYGNSYNLQLLMQKRGHYNPVNGFDINFIPILTLALVNDESYAVASILHELNNDLTALIAITPSIRYTPAFVLCLVKGQVETVREYLSFISNSKMHITTKHKLVGSMVHLPIKFNQLATTIAYTQTIIASENLSTTDKFELLNSDLLLELPYIENSGKNMALAAFIQIIQQSELTLEQKRQLLPSEQTDFTVVR